MSAIRCEIVNRPSRDPFYQALDIAADLLPGLCIKLLAAGFDPDCAVECYRPRRDVWDLRAKTVRAGAALARERGGGGQDSQPSREASTRASARLADSSKKLPVAYRAVNAGRHQLIETGTLDLDEAFDGVVCGLSGRCTREVVESWKRDYLPRLRKRGAA
jgi:hypothetical protein